MVICEILGQVGFLTLDRASALNALSVAMIESIYHTLLDWQENPAVKVVVIRSKDSKVFCAGGDIRALYHHRQEPIADRLGFFAKEYQMNLLLNKFGKPILTFMNGVTMGGGVGLGMHVAFPIAGENMLFAMPETAIGLFPDVGASYILNRLPNAWKNYVAVFGGRLNAAELVSHCLVYGCIASHQWEQVWQKLMEFKFNHQVFEQVQGILQPYIQEMPAIHEPMLEFWRFNADSFYDLMENIEQSPIPQFNELQQKIPSLSPLSMVVTFEQMKLTHGMTLEQCLELDMRLLKHFLQSSDLYEGIRAMLIDKDKHPHWQNSDWKEVPYGTVQEILFAS
ncbi:MAG: enoyl-CoA hydratase/isomerase family protein [Gammaproteobacteria bacterium]|nr:enoyl-CoA hydratase/isomerase family protein [Gammaproteobacteria bacterium]